MMLSHLPTGQKGFTLLQYQQYFKLQNCAFENFSLIPIPRNTEKFLVCNEHLQRAEEHVVEAHTLHPTYTEARGLLEPELKGGTGNHIGQLDSGCCEKLFASQNLFPNFLHTLELHFP